MDLVGIDSYCRKGFRYRLLFCVCVIFSNFVVGFTTKKIDFGFSTFNYANALCKHHHGSMEACFKNENRLNLFSRVFSPISSCAAQSLNAGLITSRRRFKHVLNFFGAYFLTTQKSLASVVAGPMKSTNLSPLQGLIVWGLCFFMSALLHCSESAITKISPFKVRPTQQP